MFSISDTQLLSDDNEFEDGEAPGEGESEAASESESEEYPSSNQIRVSFAITKVYSLLSPYHCLGLTLAELDFWPWSPQCGHGLSSWCLFS